LSRFVRSFRDRIVIEWFSTSINALMMAFAAFSRTAPFSPAFMIFAISSTAFSECLVNLPITRPVVPSVDALRYAIETLEIEKSRLVEAIRAMRAMAVTEDDYPGPRVKEQRDALQSVEQSIVFLHQAADQSRRNLQLELDRRWGTSAGHGE
jgi:hypothetical protein